MVCSTSEVDPDLYKEHTGKRPKTVMGVIKEKYPDKFELVVNGCLAGEKLFTSEEWYGILRESRMSFESHPAFYKKCRRAAGR